MRISLHVFTLGLTLAVSGACTSTNVVESELPLGTEPRPTLWATYQVELVGNQSGGGLVMTGGQIAQLGAKAEERLVQAMAQQGFALEKDAEIARSLDRRTWLRSSNQLTTLTGVWTDPATSSYRFDFATPGVDKRVTDLLSKHDPARPYFASITIFIEEARDMTVKRAPLIKVSVRVLDRDGELVFYSRTEGAGRPVAIAADRSIDNLLVGLDKALAHLQSGRESAS